MANSAFWLGLMNGIEDTYPDISKEMDFADARANFFAAARFGMDTQLCWAGDKKISPANLILEELLPMAKHGLAKANIDKEDIEYYMGIIEARTKSGMTGSNWILKSFSKINREGITRDETISAITASIYKQQHQGKPVHEWDLAKAEDTDYEPTTMLVEEFMITDLITVKEDDLIDFASSLMGWRSIRHVAVENKKGNLVGVLTMRNLLRSYLERNHENDTETVPTVGSVMVKSPLSISPEDNIMKAMELMQQEEIGCLPVLKNGTLVGIITEAEFLTITKNLIKRIARKAT